MNTEILLVVDGSGSMDHLRTDTIGGINGFVREQQAVAGECNFTLVQFDTGYRVTHKAIPVRDVKPLTMEDYLPRGGTALLDAVGRCIDETGARLRAMPEEKRPKRVIFAIITDGHENSSRIYIEPNQVQKMIEHQKTKYGWQFVFMGATIDAVDVAVNMGIGGQSAIRYAASPVGVRNSYELFSSNVASNRQGHTVSMDWSPAQRASVDPGADKP